MLFRKYLARLPWPLTLGAQTVFLPVRRYLVQNIQEQQYSGTMFELSPGSAEKIDRVLNYSLTEEYRAPTPAQVRLVSVIASELGIDPGELAFTKQTHAFSFIEKNKAAFDIIVAQREEEN